MKMVIVGLIFAAFLVIGIGMFGSTWRAMWRSSAAGSWPTTPGTITRCEIKERKGGKGGSAFEVDVAYTYSVYGRTYTGDRLAFGYQAGSDRDGSQQVCERLRSARQVAVRYDPADVSVAVLSCGVHRSIQIAAAFIVAFLLFAAGFCLIMWVSSRPDDVLLRNLLTR